MTVGGGRYLRRAGGGGFTVVELLLALSLSAVVLAAGLGAYGFMLTVERVERERGAAEVELFTAQTHLRRVFGSMTAAPPADPVALGLVDDTVPGQPDGAAAPGPDSDLALLESMLAALDDEPGESEAEAGSRVMFDLFWERLSDGVEAQALEVAVSEPPIPLRPVTDDSEAAAIEAGLDALGAEALGLLGLGRSEEAEAASALAVAGVVRLRIEVVRDAEERWLLRWRATEPAGRPEVLVRGLRSIDWEVVPPSRDVQDRPDVYSAYIEQDFPLAVRLMLETEGGTRVDWLFETGVTTLPGSEMDG